MASTISAELIEQGISRGLREALLEVGEIYVKEALRVMEEKLRKRLAEAVVGIIQTDYAIERRGNIVSIRVNLMSTQR